MKDNSSSPGDIQELNAGSEWHRWEPHIHAPGTLLNDRFTGEDAWDSYISRLEASDPPIRAVGVTDYYLTEAYDYARRQKAEGRLSRVELLFPNVELRLEVGTMKGRWLNLHLLVSPEDPEHVVQLHRFLARLRFRAYNDTFACTPEDLRRLGYLADPQIVDDRAALRHGAGQFKVNFNQLREELDQSAWAQDNVLVAVAGGSNDGTSGMQDAADVTLRREIECFAQVIFASSSSQREFWLGLRNLTEHQIRTRYGGLKPCLHGSDAHENRKVGAPDGERYSWVKGGLDFDALRQACIDPAGRAFVGAKPPAAGAPSQIIDRIAIRGAPWAATPEIAFNPGLVAIIGARGSGKTALADIVARGCDAIHDPSDRLESHPSSSFLTRAREFLGGAEVTVKWRAGEPAVRALNVSSNLDGAYPRARYLSQQFVEELCSATGMTDALLHEIERVIFESHPLDARDGAVTFAELLDLRASRFRQAREREEDAIVQLSDRISTELEKDRQLRELDFQVAQKRKQLEAYTRDRSKLVAVGSEDRVNRLTDLTAAAEKSRGWLRFFNKQEQALLALQDEVADLRQNQAPEMLRRSQDRHAASRMKAHEWEPFLVDYTGDVDTQLTSLIKRSREAATRWKGTAPNPPDTPETSLIPHDAELEKLPLALLEAEIDRLEKLISADVVIQRNFAALSKKIVTESASLQALSEKLQDAQGAKERAKALQEERERAYKRVFEAISAEQEVLIGLYKPITDRIAAEAGTLRKLGFTVSRTADVKTWAKVAEEELVDLRRQGPFKGRGNLQTIADEALRGAWESSDPQMACDAMAAFRENYQADLLEHANVPKGNQSDYRAWLKRFAQWLFSTDHIELSYGISHDGVDIRKLSPGTRGIVLLLLYLALDDADDRPLIIDQPEENLDPKSVFDELVSLFVKAKSKRQVIMVTHNANLVVNTDADQIIIASAEPHVRGELPTIAYKSGGLDNAEIRKAVCDILEGGENAFKERARRLRVRWGPRSESNLEAIGTTSDD